MKGASFSPHMTDGEFKYILEYNIHDYRILLKLWEKKRIRSGILSICGEAGKSL